MFQYRIKELREITGYKSQQAFADAFGVAQSTVAGWETGKREPDYKTTKKLAHFFNVSIDYLLGMPGATNILLDSLRQKILCNTFNSECQKKGLSKEEVTVLAQVPEDFFPRLIQHRLHRASEGDLLAVAAVLGIRKEITMFLSQKRLLDNFTSAMQKESQELLESEKEILLNIARQIKAQRPSRMRCSVIKTAAKDYSE